MGQRLNTPSEVLVLSVKSGFYPGYGGTRTFTFLRESCTRYTFTVLRHETLTFTLPPPVCGSRRLSPPRPRVRPVCTPAGRGGPAWRPVGVARVAKTLGVKSLTEDLCEYEYESHMIVTEGTSTHASTPTDSHWQTGVLRAHGRREKGRVLYPKGSCQGFQYPPPRPPRPAARPAPFPPSRPPPLPLPPLPLSPLPPPLPPPMPRPSPPPRPPP